MFECGTEDRLCLSIHVFYIVGNANSNVPQFKRRVEYFHEVNQRLNQWPGPAGSAH